MVSRGHPQRTDFFYTAYPGARRAGSPTGWSTTSRIADGVKKLSIPSYVTI
jgi:hypothetical protein